MDRPTTQVIQGEKLFDLVVRMQPQFRSSPAEIGNLLVGTPDGQQIPLKELSDIKESNGASFIYRENNSRYIGVQYSIEGRDLERAVNDGQQAIEKSVHLPEGYWMEWGGEYSQLLAAKAAAQRDRTTGGTSDLPDPVCALRQFQISVHDCTRRCDDRTRRRADRTEADEYSVQRFVRPGITRANGRIGRDRCHPCFVHQQVATGRPKRTRSYL